MENQSRRIYPYSDAFMLSSAELIATFYEEHYSLFLAFDPIRFVEGYGAILQESINRGFSAERDSLVLDQVSKEGSDVTEAIELFLEHYEDLAYYVDKCFSNEPDIQKQFHHRSISLLVKKPAELILWSEELSHATETYKEVLASSGYTEEAFLLLSNAKMEVHKHYLEQREALKRRPEKTAERVALFNTIWTIILEIHEASKRLFRKNHEIMALFDLPTVQQKREKQPEITVLTSV